MMKIFLIALIALGATAQRPPMPSPSFQLTSENYMGMRAFIDGFMSGFTASEYDLSDDCLSSAMQSKIDEAVIQAFFSIIRGHWDDYVAAIETLITDLEAMGNDCGLGLIYSSLVKDMTEKGVVHIIMNIMWHAADISEAAIEALADLVTLNWEKSGKQLGTALGYIITSQKLANQPMLETF